MVKQISVLKRFSPKFLIDKVILEEQQMVNAKAESLSVEFTNKSWVDIKVLIDGIRYTEDYLGMDLESQTSITID